jgi:hypothetical protein
MKDDAYRHILEVFGVGTGLLAEAAEKLDQNRALITPEERRQFLAQVARQGAVAMAAHGPQIATATKWQAWAKISAVLVVFGGTWSAIGAGLVYNAWSRAPAPPVLQCVADHGGSYCGYWATQPTEPQTQPTATTQAQRKPR